ncbi:MarR family winged helix-turn-helix transcriptional regulator [Caenispirillum salinarum]|uniref:MarR family winged helix-turn-helix transcriptional regulator n=1 Tax=Caenispirillum salinarum TaxID=859058 RepID=UPI00384B6CFB
MTKKTTANKLGALATALADAMADGFGDLSPSAAAAVLTLRQTETLGTTELAQVVGLSQPACTRMVDRLVADGLAQRRPARGRTVPIALTEKGRREGELIQARRLAVLRTVTEGLDKKERKDLDRLLDRLLSAVAADGAAPHRACRLCDTRVCDGKGCPRLAGDAAPLPAPAE